MSSDDLSDSTKHETPLCRDNLRVAAPHWVPLWNSHYSLPLSALEPYLYWGRGPYLACSLSAR